MKQVKILWLVAALFCATTAFGKDIKTVVFKTTPEMHCNNCETKIKNNPRFEKGVKEIVTDLGDKTVAVKYDADKTTVEALIKGFAKIKYSAVPVTEKKRAKKVLVQKRLLAQRKRKSAVLLPSEVSEIIRSMIKVFVLCVVDTFFST